jgi:hypothetical protein
VTDALLVAQETDGVLVSVLRDVSRLPRVHAACGRLAFLGVRVLGAVVTGAAPADLYGAAYRYVGYEARPEKPEEAPAGEES